MDTSLIDAARHKRDRVAKRYDELAEQLEQVGKELAEWDAFISRALGLATAKVGKGRARASANGQLSERIKVRNSALAGMAVKMILEKGPQTLDAIVESIRAKGFGKDADPDKFRATVNSALWRRLDDVFEKKDDGSYHLQTRDIELVGD